VGYRLALDHPDCVERLALLDILPTGEVFDRADARFAFAFWPWSLLAQPSPLPETLMAAAPQAIVENALSQWGSDLETFTPNVRKAYVAALRIPGAIHAICEEYRATATLDKLHDDLDRRSGRTIECPVLALWSEGGPVDLWYEDAGGPLGILRTWAPGVQGRRIRGGHFFPEQNSEETAAALHEFLCSDIPDEIRSMQGEMH
jgi:haloacetate dehalogenase